MITVSNPPLTGSLYLTPLGSLHLAVFPLFLTFNPPAWDSLNRPACNSLPVESMCSKHKTKGPPLQNRTQKHRGFRCVISLFPGSLLSRGQAGAQVQRNSSPVAGQLGGHVQVSCPDWFRVGKWERRSPPCQVAQGDMHTKCGLTPQPCTPPSASVNTAWDKQGKVASQTPSRSTPRTQHQKRGQVCAP